MIPLARAITVKDNVTDRLNKLPQNIVNAMNRGVIESVELATAAMTKQVNAAVTKTGTIRASGGKPLGPVRPAWYAHRGPGRVESGRMINSIHWIATETTGGVTAQAGFINAPGYTALQEQGDGHVPPMLAYAMGHTTMQAKFPATMTKYLNSAIRAAELNRIASRGGL